MGNEKKSASKRARRPSWLLHTSMNIRWMHSESQVHFHIYQGYRKSPEVPFQPTLLFSGREAVVCGNFNMGGIKAKEPLNQLGSCTLACSSEKIASIELKK